MRGGLTEAVRSQFLSEWEAGSYTPSFEKVYEVLLPRDARNRHDQFRCVSYILTHEACLTLVGRGTPPSWRFAASTHPSASATSERRKAFSAVPDRAGFAWSSSQASSRLRSARRAIRDGAFAGIAMRSNISSLAVDLAMGSTRTGIRLWLTASPLRAHLLRIG